MLRKNKEDKNGEVVFLQESIAFYYKQVSFNQD